MTRFVIEETRRKGRVEEGEVRHVLVLLIVSLIPTMALRQFSFPLRSAIMENWQSASNGHTPLTNFSTRSHHSFASFVLFSVTFPLMLYITRLAYFTCIQLVLVPNPLLDLS